MSSSVQLFKDQKYHELKSQCIQQRRLFEDPKFPASDESLFYQSASRRKVEWKRPKVNDALLVRRCSLYCFTPTVFSVLKHGYASMFSLLFSIHFLSEWDSDSSPSVSHCCPKSKSCLTVKRQRESILCSVVMRFTLDGSLITSSSGSWFQP